MADNIKKRSRGSIAYTALRVLAYAVMIALILIFFSGHGEFIYEGF